MNNKEAKLYLGKEIARRLIRLPGTQKDLAEMCNVSSTTIGNVVNGYYERHAIRMYIKLAEQLGVVIEFSVEDKS